MIEEIQVPEERIISDNRVINEIINKILSQESGLSYSALSNFNESPRDFIKYKLRKVEPTEAMIYGSMLHCLVLEPTDFYKRYFVLDDENKKKEIGGAKPGGTSAYKEWVAQMRHNAGDRTLVTAQNFRIASQIALDVRFNDASRRVLELCPNREIKVKWEYGNFIWTGFKDMDGEGAICDLKSCSDANPKKFQRDIYYMDYDLQAAMYLKADAINRGDDSHRAVYEKDFYWIAVDQKGGVSTHQCSKNLIDRGLKKYDYLIEKFSQCILEDKFDASYEFFADRWDGIYDADRPW